MVAHIVFNLKTFFLVTEGCFVHAFATLLNHLLSFPGASEGTIAMQEGEELAVVEEDKGDGWTRVRRSNGDEGYIPTSYVTISLDKWQTHEEQSVETSITPSNCMWSLQNVTNWEEATAQMGGTTGTSRKGTQIGRFDLSLRGAWTG